MRCRDVQVLDYVLEPLPWLLMAVYELSNEQQRLFDENNPQEESSTATSWLAKSGTASSASELSSAESAGSPKSSSKSSKGGSKTTSGDDSQGEQNKVVRKPKKKVDQQTKDAKTIQMLKDAVNRVKVEQKEQLRGLRHKDDEIKKLKEALALHIHGADSKRPSTLSPLQENSEGSKADGELESEPTPESTTQP
jgi:hypothetical protein